MTTRPENVPSERAVRVLLVDDERKLRDTLAEGLRLEDWSVTTADTGASAVQLATSGPFDLLVLDWMLPDIDGLDVLRCVRARAPGLPVLIISARSLPADRRTALAAGASEFLSKPFAFTELLTHCRVLLARAAPTAPFVFKP